MLEAHYDTPTYHLHNLVLRPHYRGIDTLYPRANLLASRLDLCAIADVRLIVSDSRALCFFVWVVWHSERSYSLGSDGGRFDLPLGYLSLY